MACPARSVAGTTRSPGPRCRTGGSFEVLRTEAKAWQDEAEFCVQTVGPWQSAGPSRQRQKQASEFTGPDAAEKRRHLQQTAQQTLLPMIPAACLMQQMYIFQDMVEVTARVWGGNVFRFRGLAQVGWDCRFTLRPIPELE